MKPIEHKMLVSPCRKCPDNPCDHRQSCLALARFTDQLIGETTIGGVSDMEGNGYHLVF